MDAYSTWPIAAEGFACCAAIRSRMQAVNTGLDIWLIVNKKAKSSLPRKKRKNLNHIIQSIYGLSVMDEYQKVKSTKLKFKGNILPVKDTSSK